MPYIYKSQYEGWYCLPDEKFLLDSEVVDAKCPDCGRPVERITEENYFFRMSGFQKDLEKYLEDHPEFVQPNSRRNELFNNFIKPGLTDVSITRNTVKWGIRAPVPEDTVIYVWFDALLNYITALDWPDGEKYKKFWCGKGADEHEAVNLIGKDILRFHATIWPCMLMAAGVPLPTRVFGTGFINMGGQKMSKSLGNVVNPMDVIDQYGPDALRYYLLREVAFGSDGLFTAEAFELRFNGDLANDMGNLVHRSLTMIEKYFNGEVPKPGASGPIEEEIRSLAAAYASQAREALKRFAFDKALEALWAPVKRANKYIEESAPWKVAKGGNQERLATIMYTLAETIRVTAIGLAPFLPETSQKIWTQLGYKDEVHQHILSETETWGLIPSGQKVSKGHPLFPRIERKKD